MPRLSRLLAISAFALSLALLPSVANATIIMTYSMCTSSEGCDQTLNFIPQPNGITQIADTNPPAPFYDVTFTELDNLTNLLVTTGGNLGTVDKIGFTSLLITPDSPYAWGAIEFQLDSYDKTLATTSTGLTLTAWDQFGTAFTFENLNFPWESNSGENQHYTLAGTLGEVITQVRIDYNGGPNGTNRIQDMHNIDVNSVLNPVPEPATLTLLGLGLVGLGYRAKRKQA